MKLKCYVATIDETHNLETNKGKISKKNYETKIKSCGIRTNPW